MIGATDGWLAMFIRRDQTQINHDTSLFFRSNWDKLVSEGAEIFIKIARRL